MPAVQTPSPSINIPCSVGRRFFGLISGGAGWVILIGLAIRIWVGLHSVIVNPDGALYIHQAMAMYYRNWSSLKTCALTFISAYPFLIAGGYYVIHDWILSARLISLFFGVAMLIPLYLIVKEWVREDIAILTLSVFAVTPVLVSNSVELVRDPICWFFLSAGTLAVIHPATRRSPWRLLIASICFLTAAWARIEAILYLAVTLGYLLSDRKNTKATGILFFLSPLLAILFFSIAGLVFSGLSFSDLHRGNEIAGKFIEPIRRYQDLADSLKSLVWSSPNPFMEFFLPEARNLIWLIALGTVLNRFLEAFFYPFVVFYLLGLSGLRKYRSDARLRYLVILSAFGLALLYIHTLHTWMLYYRFFGIVMIPAAVFCAFGIERLLDILPRKLSIQSSTVFWLIFLLIIGVSLPKNLKSPDSDKSVFVQIGETVFQHSPQSSGIRIASSRHTQTWLSFYANLHFPQTPPCPLDPANCWESYPDDPEQFKNQLRQNRQKFVLWEEKHWPFHNFGLSDPSVLHTFQELGRWYHRDTGNMILYAVRNTDD